MSESPPFGGFAGIGRATAIPNAFFAGALPAMRAPGDLLAFLWTARLVQEQRGEARFVTADQVWAAPGAADSFERLADGRASLERGLAACAELGALLALDLAVGGEREVVYFVNNPASRRAVARARAGELALRPDALVREPPRERAPDIFLLYEEHIGTITPMVGERLLAAAERFPAHLVEAAFREAAERNVRNWRYVERILERWAEEGHAHEATGQDPADRRRRYFLGDGAGSAAR